MNRQQRKRQYEETGRAVGGWVGRCIAFLAPLTALVPKAWWGVALSALVAAGGGLVGRATAPSQPADVRVERLVGAVDTLSLNVRELTVKVDQTRGKVDTVSIRMGNLSGAFAQLPGGRRALQKYRQQKAFERELQGSPASAPFDPSEGFTASVLSGETPLFGGKN